jgi:uncharacterized MnhB-related membrane protein
MEKFNVILVLFLAIATVVTAIGIVFTKKLSFAILASGVVSLFASIFFIVLASPDVAMTEAAIGAGLTTFLFFVILRKTEKSDDKK